MIDAWMLWLVLVGLAIGLIVAWLLLVRLPPDESDASPSERRAEAAWIRGTIEFHGGIAPQTLVEEILDLHEAYLRDAAQPRMNPPRPPLPPASGPPQRPPVGGPPPPPPSYPAPPRGPGASR